jgi:hypothetical protein
MKPSQGKHIIVLIFGTMLVLSALSVFSPAASIDPVVPTDDTPPSVTSPEDIIYTEGSTGHEISWVLTDDDPGIYYIYLDGTQIGCGYWSSGTEVTINVDGHTPGVYEYSIVACDVTCYFCSDIVVVTVLEAATTTTTTTTTHETTTTPSPTTTTEGAGTTSPIPTVISPLPAGTLPVALGISGIILVLNIYVMKRRP